jgi:dethiobiotin synthetase
MKKNATTIAIASILMLAGATISSCKKSSTTTPPATTYSNTSSAKDYQDTENNSNDIDQIGSEGIDNSNVNSNYKLVSGSGGMLSPMSGSVTVTPSLINKTVTITFLNYVGLDGHLRSGTIMYDYSTSLATAMHYRDSGIVINVTTPNNDYYVDSNQVQINKKITNKGRITNGNLTWHVTTSLSVAKAGNGGTIQWYATRDNMLLNTHFIL